MLDERKLITRGVEIDVPFAVRTWKETRYRFHAARNRLLTRAIVVHWTAAENPPAAVFHNMSAENLAVHFIVDSSGTVWQMMDTDDRGVHAGTANAWTIGIEFIGRGSNLKAPVRATIRPRVTEDIHGREVVYDDLMPRQIAAGVKLCETLCNLYGLPLQVPTTSAGELLTGEMSDEYTARFVGVCGHLHLERTKVDPGLTLLRAIQERGRALSDRIA